MSILDEPSISTGIEVIRSLSWAFARLPGTARVMDRAVGIVDNALAYSPELGFLSFGGRWRGSSGSYRNNWGFDGAGAGLRLRVAIRSWISLRDRLSS